LVRCFRLFIMEEEELCIILFFEQILSRRPPPHPHTAEHLPTPLRRDSNMYVSLPVPIYDYKTLTLY
jgi:hypothetical protein